MNFIVAYKECQDKKVAAEQVPGYTKTLIIWKEEQTKSRNNRYTNREETKEK